MKREGAELAFSYLNDKLKPRVEEFAKEFGSDIVLPLDVATDESISECFAELSKHWDKFDGFVHAIAFAPGDQLDGDMSMPLPAKGIVLLMTLALTALLP